MLITVENRYSGEIRLETVVDVNFSVTISQSDSQFYLFVLAY